MMTLTGLSPAFNILLIVSLVFGLTLGWIDTYTSQSVVDANRAESAKSLSIFQGWYGVGAIAAPVVISLLLLKNSWQGAYLILAPLVLIVFIIFIATTKLTGKYLPASAIEGVKLSGEDIILFLKDRMSLYLLISIMTYYIMQYGLFAWLVRYMTVQYNSESMGMAAITTMWVCTVIARFVVPRLPVDNMKVHAYGSVFAGITLFIGIVSGQPVLMCVMVGAGALATGNSLAALINRCIVNYKGNSLLPASSMFLSMQIIGMIFPPLLGWISVYSLQASMIFLVVGILVSALFGFVILRSCKCA
jgi:MFS family permease